jgi:hypothetical protein
MNTKKKGDLATTMVAAKLLKAEYSVLTPIGDNERYDLVVEKGGLFSRIQCKWGKICPSGVWFKCRSVHGENGTYTSQNYIGQVEFFGVYCLEIDKTYLIPINECLGYRKTIPIDSEYII